MKLKLVVVEGKPRGQEISISAAKFLIGRGPECHLRPNSELVSRHHCMLVADGNGVTLRDLGSTNGTLVNGQRISGAVAVCHKDLIQIGPLGFRMIIEGIPAPALPKPESSVAVAAISEAAVASQAHTTGTGNSKDDDPPARLMRSGRPCVPGTDSERTGDESELIKTHADTAEAEDTQYELPVIRRLDQGASR
jgi:pSer/pThr/pTyr-binding forkhead associated (FHA) protein